MAWYWHRRRSKPSLEDRMDLASHDHYRFCEGYHAGYWEGFKSAQWLYRTVHEGEPAPERREADKLSPYRRLIKHYNKLWKRGEE